MAELLTNNPEAMTSLTGRTTSNPCGFFRLSPCSYNNFNDWFNTLTGRFTILTRNYDKIKRDVEKGGGDTPGGPRGPLSGDEQTLGFQVDAIKDSINELKKTPPGLDRDTYYKLITDVQRALADTNSAIEQAQLMLDERSVPFVTTGIQARPGGDGMGWGTVALVGIGVVGLWWGIRAYKGMKRQESVTAAFQQAARDFTPASLKK